MSIGAFLSATGCGSGSSATGTTTPSSTALPLTGGHGAIGRLSVTRAYVPDPATPSLAAAYFTVRNSGPQDRLLSVRSPQFGMAMLHRYVTTADGAEAMVPVRSGVAIPAHGDRVLKPGSYHLMLMKPLRPVRQGTVVRLVLTFARAGVLSLEVPVVADTGLPTDTGQNQMPGMNMSGSGK